MDNQIVTSEVSDADLVQAIRSGNRAAEYELVRRWRPRLVALGRAIVHDDGLAEDAAQLALWKVFLHLGHYDSSRPFEPWILKIAGNVARDLRRKIVRERTLLPMTADDSVLDDVAVSPNHGDESALCPEEKEAFDACMERLDESHRTVTTLFAVGFSLTESGAILGKPKSTVQSCLNQALAQLRRCSAGSRFVHE